MIPAPFTLQARVEIVVIYLLGLILLFLACALVCDVAERVIRRFQSWWFREPRGALPAGRVGVPGRAAPPPCRGAAPGNAARRRSR